MAKRKGKISVAIMLGLFASGKRIWDYEKYLKTRDDLTDSEKMNARIAHWTGYAPLTNEWYGPGNLIMTAGPVAMGYGVHKYVGGKDKNGNGLNLNAQLRAIPMFHI